MRSFFKKSHLITTCEKGPLYYSFFFFAAFFLARKLSGVLQHRKKMQNQDICFCSFWKIRMVQGFKKIWIRCYRGWFCSFHLQVLPRRSQARESSRWNARSGRNVGQPGFEPGTDGLWVRSTATTSQQLIPQNHSGKLAFRATANCCDLSRFFVCQWSTNGPRKLFEHIKGLHSRRLRREESLQEAWACNHPLRPQHMCASCCKRSMLCLRTESK